MNNVFAFIINRKRFISIVVMSLMFSMQLFAQLSDKPNAHVIITIDNALPSSYWDYLTKNKVEIISTLNKCMEKCDLDTNGYVSMVTFAIGLGNTSFDGFARPVKYSRDRDFFWMPYADCTKLLNSNKINWQEIVSEGRNRVVGEPFSLLTGAKQFAVNSLNLSKKNSSEIAANRTFLVVITDDFYNGGDSYSKEFNSYKGTGGRASEKEFFSMIDRFGDMFNLKFVDKYNLIGDAYKMILYEMRPVNKPSISSVVSYPASLGLQRIRGGYEIKFEASSVDEMYQLLKLKIDVTKKDGSKQTLITSSDANGDCKVDMKLEYGEINPDSLQVTLRAWLRQCDDIYDGFVLNPYDSMCSKLVVNVNTSCSSDGLVLGMPLNDVMWWWYPEDIKLAAFLWEVLIILIIVIIVVSLLFYYNRKTSVYEVESSEISIKPYEKQN